MIAWLSLAFAAPTPVQLTADEVSTLAQGEIIVRPPTDSGEMVGIVDIPGVSRERLMDIVLDWDMRVESVGAIKRIVEYAPETDPLGLGVTFELSVIGTEVVYHLRYDVDRAEGWCTFALDPEKQNDIVATHGSYRIVPIDGGQRLEYRSVTDTGRSVPAFVRKWIATGSIRDQLQEMRSRAGG